MADRLTRIRGQEATIRISTVDHLGVNLPLEGSFFKVRDFTWNVDDEIKKDGFLGEIADDLDHQVHGFDGSFSIDKADGAATAYTRRLVAASLASVAPPIATIMVISKFRDVGIPRDKVIFAEGILRMATEAIASRKDFVNNAFEWSAKILLP